ncbi:MAG TPA: asparagine synthase C-terminal domain-containing protein [Bryobacteraceae bacterium]|nr:asparagine synthase C-terminal domain-containing protein [Bryobacteraceae bacterium]
MLTPLIRRATSDDLDYDALNVFLRIGTFVGSDTPFRYLKADPPDYAWAASVPPVQGSRDQILDSYIDLFRQAVSRCYAEGRKIGLGLSGGRDSRHILFELLRAGRPPARCWTVDFPAKPSDARVAAEICRRVGVPHLVYPIQGRFATLERVKNKITNYSSLQHNWMTEAVLSGLAETPVLFDGIGGDVLSAGLFLTAHRVHLLEQHRIDELVDDIVGKTLPTLRNPSLFPRQRALEKVNEEFRKHLAAPDPISSFYFWNRTRRDIGSSAFALLRQRGQTVFAPYLDRDLSRFLAGLTPSLTVDHQLHTDVIARAFPQWADIPYASSNETSRRALTYYRRTAADILRYALRNPSPLVRRRKLCAQLLRSMTVETRSADVLWLAPATVYLTELLKEIQLPKAA